MVTRGEGGRREGKMGKRGQTYNGMETRLLVVEYDVVHTDVDL